MKEQTKKKTTKKKRTKPTRTPNVVWKVSIPLLLDCPNEHHTYSSPNLCPDMKFIDSFEKISHLKYDGCLKWSGNSY